MVVSKAWDSIRLVALGRNPLQAASHEQVRTETYEELQKRRTISKKSILDEYAAIDPGEQRGPDRTPRDHNAI